MKQETSPRALALKTLLRIESDGSFSNLAVDAALKNAALSAPDKRLFTVLVYGVTEKKITLDYIISALSARPIESLDGKVRMLLRLGLYQLFCLDRIPEHAAVNETVALADKKTAGFVNACLRSYLRKRKTLLFPKKEDGLLPYLSVTYSVPTALAERFVREFGEERAESVLRSFSRAPSVTVAVNPLRAESRDAYLERLLLLGYDATPTATAPNGIVLSGASSIASLPDFENGACYVQDEASQICVEVLGALPGETVIDACSCPGSKSFGSAIRMKNKGRVSSFDLHENKLSLVRSGAERLGITILTAAQKNGKEFDPALEESADRVLCDVPCSGYGIIGEKPDIRYKDPSDADRLPDVQYAILDNCSRYVKHGGVLVYSTCTVFSSENGENVARFLAEHKEFVPEDFTVGTFSSEGGMLTLTPDAHGTDGFFVARMRRV